MRDTIREATPADVPALEIVRRQAVEATYAEFTDRSVYADAVASADPALPAWIDDPNWLVLVFETRVTPVAYAAVDCDRGRLVALYTAPDYRRRGYARRIVTTLQERLREQGESVLDAVVPVAVEPFFRAVGFDRVGSPSTDEIPTVPMQASLP